ncbi:MAG: leucyl aminopeptidase [bacterium]|jgi:leucyl aminopeptidase
MKFAVLCQDINTLACDALIVNLFRGVKEPGGATGAADAALGGMIRELIEAGDIKGDLNETTVIHTFGRMKARRVIVVGLGKQAEFDYEKVKSVTAAGLRAAARCGGGTVATIAHGAGIGGLDAAAVAQAVTEAAFLSLYEYTNFKTDKPENGERKIETVILIENNKNKIDALNKGAAKGEVCGRLTNQIRDLVNAPANAMTPSILAAKAQEVTAGHGVNCTVYGREDIAAFGMGAFTGVARGSAEEPKLIVLRYTPDSDSKETLALVGKGLTFDSGGISIKPAEGMQEMKDDMAGGAAVIGAMGAIAALGLRINVLGIIAATENMPGGKAQRPGDVVKTCSGKTIEVVNTDCEGRLVLADAVAYAVKCGATRIFDIATLTGSCVVAFGKITSGYVTNDDNFGSLLQQAAAASGDKVWPFPAFPEYKEAIKSDIADWKNLGGRPAGAITGGLLIGAFAGDIPWIHLDIAGTAWSDKDLPYISKGATGVGVGIMTCLAEILSKQ